MKKHIHIFIILIINNIQLLAQGMQQLVVPDGFKYETIQDLQLELSFPELEEGVYLYQIQGLDKDGNSNLLMQNFLPLSKTLKTEVNIPLHIETIQIVLKNGQKILVYDYPKEPYITNQTVGIN